MERGSNTAGVDLPTDGEGITAAWMEGVLHRNGALPTGSRVAELAVERFGEGVGLLSFLYRATPTYAGAADGAPASVVVKVPTGDPLQRGTADALAFYAREVRFYRELAAEVPFRSARCFAAEMAEGSTDFVLVLEDLSALRPLDQVAGCSWDDAVQAVDTLAAFHARWWGDERLADLATTYMPLRNPMYEVALPSVFLGGWTVAREVARDLLGPDVLAFGDRWGELCPWMLDQLMDPTTLIHGDWRSDNLFRDGEELVVIDFQIMGTGAGPYDLAYFMSQSVESDVRRGRDAEMLDRYVAGLSAGGVDADRELVGLQYRLALAFCFIYGVSSFQTWENLNERGRSLMRTMLRRSASAIADTDALLALPS